MTLSTRYMDGAKSWASEQRHRVQSAMLGHDPEVATRSRCATGTSSRNAIAAILAVDQCAYRMSTPPALAMDGSRVLGILHGGERLDDEAL